MSSTIESEWSAATGWSRAVMAVGIRPRDGVPVQQSWASQSASRSADRPGTRTSQV
jgi:hypothetical protein